MFAGNRRVAVPSIHMSNDGVEVRIAMSFHRTRQTGFQRGEGDIEDRFNIVLKQQSTTDRVPGEFSILTRTAINSMNGAIIRGGNQPRGVRCDRNHDARARGMWIRPAADLRHHRMIPTAIVMTRMAPTPIVTQCNGPLVESPRWAANPRPSWKPTLKTALGSSTRRKVVQERWTRPPTATPTVRDPGMKREARSTHNPWRS